MARPDDLYRFHVENLRAVDKGLRKVGRLLRRAISERDEKTESALVRLYALLLGAWAECRLRKLLFEPHGFSPNDRSAITRCGNLFDEWATSIELAFRSHYSVPRGPLSTTTLPHSAYARYSSLIDTLRDDLRPVIEIRNRLAHGQWAYLLNSENTDVNPAYMAAIHRENILSLQFKQSLLDHMSNAVHDLVVSRPTFERDFDWHYRHIVEVRRNLHTRDYAEYQVHMRAKLERARGLRGAAPPGEQESAT
jgi:hypothetical protein